MKCTWNYSLSEKRKWWETNRPGQIWDLKHAGPNHYPKGSLNKIIACHNVVVLNDKTWQIQMRVHNSCIVYGCIVKKLAWSWFFHHKYWPLCLLLWCFPGFITISSVTMITPVFLLVLKTMELWLLLTAFCHASGTVRNCSYFSVFVCPTCFISIYFVALFYFMLFCCFILVLFYFDLLCFVSSQ